MFSEAVCLSIDKRASERPRIQAEFARYGITVQFFTAGKGGEGAAEAPAPNHIDVAPPPRSGYPAWANRPNSYNAFLSFQTIVSSALDREVKELLLLEDDVTLLPEFGQVVAAAQKQLLEHDPDWDMLYLGANHSFARTRQIADNLLHVRGSGCWHAVVLRESVFKAVLGLPMDGPIDGMCARHIHPQFSCYAVWPNVAVTRPGFSYCEGRIVDYSEMFLVKGC
jgi:hypothetical protein